MNAAVNSMTKLTHSKERASDAWDITMRSARLTRPSQPIRQAKGAAEELPPVIIMNLFYTGLAIARDLAGYGMRVIGLSAHREAPGNRTRFCEVRNSPNSQEQPEQLVEYLLGHAEELHGAVIFPTRDFDVLFLDHYRELLEPRYRLAIPHREALHQVVDKYSLACIAQRAGLPVPKTMILRCAEEFGQVSREIGFPCVAKPVSSYQWREGANWETVGGRKAFLLDSMQALEQEYAQVRLARHEVLIQEWIPGGTENIVVLGGYVGPGSEPLAYFTARKIVQSPDESFGTGCIVRSEDIPELLEPTVRLWKALGYRGMAEVEYKFDQRSKEFKLIEINTRHWDQHALGRASGVNLSWTAYSDLTGREVNFKKVPTIPTNWIAEDALTYHALRGLYERKLKLGKLWHQMRRPRIYGTFSPRDPLPFVDHFLRGTIPVLAGQCWRKLIKGLESQ